MKRWNDLLVAVLTLLAALVSLLLSSQTDKQPVPGSTIIVRELRQVPCTPPAIPSGRCRTACGGGQ
jgi:hypothetical protein